MQRPALFQFYTTMSMRSKFTRCAPQRKIRAVRRTSIYNNNNDNIWKIPDVSSMWGFAALAPIILGECRALWGERSEAWYRVTAAADAEQKRMGSVYM